MSISLFTHPGYDWWVWRGVYANVNTNTEVIHEASADSQFCAQACPPQCFPFFGLAPSVLAQLSLQQLNPQVHSTLRPCSCDTFRAVAFDLNATQTPSFIRKQLALCWQGMLQTLQATLPAQYLGQYSGLTPGQVGQPIAARPCSLSKLQRSEFSGTSGDPLSAVPIRTAERRANANGSEGNRSVAVLAVVLHALPACFLSCCPSSCTGPRPAPSTTLVKNAG